MGVVIFAKNELKTKATITAIAEFQAPRLVSLLPQLSWVFFVTQLRIRRLMRCRKAVLSFCLSVKRCTSTNFQSGRWVDPGNSGHAIGWITSMKNVVVRNELTLDYVVNLISFVSFKWIPNLISLTVICARLCRQLLCLFALTVGVLKVYTKSAVTLFPARIFRAHMQIILSAPPSFPNLKF